MDVKIGCPVFIVVRYKDHFGTLSDYKYACSSMKVVNWGSGDDTRAVLASSYGNHMVFVSKDKIFFKHVSDPSETNWSGI